LSDEERRRLEGVVYNGVICASALLRRSLGGYYLTYITDRSIPFTAVIEMSSLVDSQRHFGGNTLIYLPRYVTGDDAFWNLSDEEIEARFLQGLRKIYPGLPTGDILAFRVARARQVYAVSTLNYSDHLPPMITSVPGLSIVNSAHIVNASLAVNETVSLAEAALPRLMAAADGAATSRPAINVSGIETPA
jgi:protoporphyrinogen oxidase